MSSQIQRNDVPIKKTITSPGRAVRGKLENMVLYCTLDNLFLSFYFIFFPFGREQQKLALHDGQPVQSSNLYKQKHIKYNFTKKKKNLTDSSAPPL